MPRETYTASRAGRSTSSSVSRSSRRQIRHHKSSSKCSNSLLLCLVQIEAELASSWRPSGKNFKYIAIQVLLTACALRVSRVLRERMKYDHLVR